MPVAKETRNFEPAPAGTHLARCYGCISLGTQHSDNFADAFKVMLMWELPNELIGTGDKEMPMTISKEYTLSLGKKSTLRKHLEMWRGRGFTDAELQGFEVSDVLGHPCMLTVVHAVSGRGETYAKVESVSSLPKGMQCPLQQHEQVRYEIEYGRNEVFKKLPEWIQKKILDCEELSPTTATQQDRSVEAAAAPTEDDSVPF